MGAILTIVFQDVGKESWFTDEPFDEEYVRSPLKRLSIPVLPGRRERSLRLELSASLTAQQHQELLLLQDQGFFSAFFVTQEEYGTGRQKQFVSPTLLCFDE